MKPLNRFVLTVLIVATFYVAMFASWGSQAVEAPESWTVTRVIVLMLSLLPVIVFGLFGASALSYQVQVRLGRRIGFHKRTAYSLEMIESAAGQGWFLQSPTEGLGFVPITYEYPNDDVSNSRRLAIQLLVPPVCVGACGLGLWYAGHEASDDYIAIWVIQYLAAIFLAFTFIELLPFRLGRWWPTGYFAWRTLLDPSFAHHLLWRCEMAAREFGLEPSVSDVAMGENDLDLTRGSVKRVTLARAIEVRSKYLSALARNDSAAAATVYQELDKEIRHELLSVANRNSIRLLLAFHAAWFIGSPEETNAHLQSIGSGSDVEHSPLFGLVVGIHKCNQGDTRNGIRNIEEAEEAWCSVGLVSGTTRVWLDCCGLKLADDEYARERSVERRRQTSVLSSLPSSPAFVSQPIRPSLIG